MTPKTALITGITGQDGTYLAELLLQKGYDVHGLVRVGSRTKSAGLLEAGIMARRSGRILALHSADMSDSAALHRIVRNIRPEEVYNLAAQSHVATSFNSPDDTMDVNGMGALRLLEAIRLSKIPSRFFQASSAELFGKPAETPQSESTPFNPKSPYAAAKLYAFWIVKNYRESYRMHAGNGILFNHESPRRGENFVTRKITLSLAAMKAGRAEVLRIGSLDAKRDWGYAPDYAELMWLMLQQPEADDYVAATGETHSVREFIEAAARHAGFEIAWEGTGADELGRDAKSGKVMVEIDPCLYRPSGAEMIMGDPAKARAKLGWSPKVKFERLVEIMMRADLAASAA